MTLKILYVYNLSPEEMGCCPLMGLIDPIPVSPAGSVV